MDTITESEAANKQIWSYVTISGLGLERPM
jgi:hypothetical protein